MRTGMIGGTWSRTVVPVLAYASLTFCRTALPVNTVLPKMTQIWLATDPDHL
jgi:hypothetical protein